MSDATETTEPAEQEAPAFPPQLLVYPRRTPLNAYEVEPDAIFYEYDGDELKPSAKVQVHGQSARRFVMTYDSEGRLTSQVEDHDFDPDAPAVIAELETPAGEIPTLEPEVHEVTKVEATVKPKSTKKTEPAAPEATPDAPAAS